VFANFATALTAKSAARAYDFGKTAVKNECRLHAEKFDHAPVALGITRCELSRFEGIPERNAGRPV